jgi:hypothetical protein
LYRKVRKPSGPGAVVVRNKSGQHGWEFSPLRGFDDPGEQLIANVLLSIIACQLHSDTAARPFVFQAHAIALELAEKSLSYRPPSKFARLVFQIAGETESILYAEHESLLDPVNNGLLFRTFGRG